MKVFLLLSYLFIFLREPIILGGDELWVAVGIGCVYMQGIGPTKIYSKQVHFSGIGKV